MAERLTLSRSSGNGGWPWANSSGWVEVAQFLGIVSRGKRPGNRLWELLRAGKLKNLPHVRIGGTYRFNMADVEAWVRRQAGGGLNGLARSR